MKSLPSFRNNTNTPVSTLWEPLPPSVDIKGWWRRTLSPDAEAQVGKVLEELKKRHRWLACECNADAAAPPLFTISVNPGGEGGLHLRRLTKRDPHADNCPFSFERRPNLVLPGRADIELPIVPPSFLEPDPPVDGPRGPGGGPGRGDDTDDLGLSTLARQLYWILHHSGVQSWNSASEGSIKTILSYAKDCPFAGGLGLHNVLFCKSTALTEGWVQSAFSRCEEQRLRPQAILICPVFELDAMHRRVNLSNNPDDADWHKVPGQFKIYGDDQALTRFPYLMYAKILPSDNGPEIAKAYLHPMFNQRLWTLVDSQLERDAMAQLMAAAKSLSRDDIDIEIAKPVFNWMETAARPDFVIQAKRGAEEYAFMVETMGSKDEEYLLRKERTIEKLAPSFVFKDDRTQHKEVADERMNRFMYGRLFGKLVRK